MAAAHERFMQIAVEEACRGTAEGSVAVGSVVVHDGNIIARGRNLVATESDPTADACTAASTWVARQRPAGVPKDSDGLRRQIGQASCSRPRMTLR